GRFQARCRPLLRALSRPHRRRVLLDSGGTKGPGLHRQRAGGAFRRAAARAPEEAQPPVKGNPYQVGAMNKTPLYTTLLWVCCAAVPLVAADPAAPGPWRSLLQDDSAPDWRGWKEPGFPAGWHVAGGKTRLLPAAPVGRAVV